MNFTTGTLLNEQMSYDLIKTSIKNSINKISKESYINYFKSSLEKNKKDIELSKSRYVRKPKIYIVFKISNETNLIFHFTAYNAKNNILSLKILFNGYSHSNKILYHLILSLY